jgi:hypothetical protein
VSTNLHILRIGFLVIGMMFSAKAVTRVSTASGSWSTSTNWSPSGVPACGDSIIIQPTHTINITAHVNFSACGGKTPVVIKGKLFFVGGSKLRLPCNSRLYLYNGAEMDSDGSGASNQLEICGNDEWNGSQGKVIGANCFPPSPGCGNFVLPISLVYFTSESISSGNVLLKWETATEINHNYFDIERSTDGIFYRSAGIVNSKAPFGNSRSTLDYQFVDESAGSGLVYYRLRVVDLQGGSEYSPIIYNNIEAGKDVRYTIAPNPNEGRFTLQVTGAQIAGPVNFSVSDCLGNVILRENFYSENSSVTHLIDLGDKAAPGVYVCSMSFGSSETQLKMVVK